MKVASGNVLWKQRKRNWCRTPFTFTVYTLTDKEMSIKTGILNEKFNLIKLFRIVDISVERSFLQRLFGMSTLVLDTRDQSSGNGVVVLKNIVHGFEVRQALQEAVDASRKENGMSARELVVLVAPARKFRVSTMVLTVLTWTATPTDSSWARTVLRVRAA